MKLLSLFFSLPRWLRIALFSVGLLLSVLLLAVQILSWHGNREFKRVLAELKAEGETLDFQRCLPDLVPDEDNFGAIPALRDIADETKGEAARQRLNALKPLNKSGGTPPSTSNGASTGIAMGMAEWGRYFGTDKGAAGILEMTTGHEPLLNELMEAADKPHSAFTPQWKQRSMPKLLLAAKLPQYSAATNACKMLVLRACAESQTGTPSKAVDATGAVVKLAQASLEEPFLIGLLVGATCATQAVEMVWHLTRDQKLSGEQYQRLAQLLSTIDLDTAALRAWRGELAAGANAVEYLIKTRKFGFITGSDLPDSGGLNLIPEGILRLNAARYCDWTMRYAISPLKEHGVVETMAKQRELNELLIRHRGRFILHPGSVLAQLAIPAGQSVLEKVVHTQALLKLARAACLIEAVRLKTGTYPADLAGLDAIDPWTRMRLLYATTPEGRYKLWSVGPDGRDDGGNRNLDPAKPGGTKITKSDFKGDWVWSYTTP